METIVGQAGYAPVLTPDGVRKIEEVSVGQYIWAGKRWDRIKAKTVLVGPCWQYDTGGGSFYGSDQHPHIVLNQIIKIEGSVVIGSGRSPETEFSLLDEKDIRAGAQYAGMKGTVDPPEEYLRGDYKKVRGFLRGYFGRKGYRFRFVISACFSSFRLYEMFAHMLAVAGVDAYYVVSKARPEVHVFNPSYMMKITHKHSRRVFAETIGFADRNKQKALEQSVINCRNVKPKAAYKVTNKKKLSDAVVLTLLELENENSYWSNGLLVGDAKAARQLIQTLPDTTQETSLD